MVIVDLVREIQAAAAGLDGPGLTVDPAGQAPDVLHLAAVVERLLTALDEALDGPEGTG